MVTVLVLASGAGWESTAMNVLSQDPATVVLKRCVDVDDLLATAATGQAEAALVALDAPGLDPAAVNQLHGHGVRVVAVAADPGREDLSARAARLALVGVVPASALSSVPGLLRSTEDSTTRVRPGLPTADVAGPGLPGPGAPQGPGATDAAGLPQGTGPDGPAGAPGPAGARKVVAVWGPAGAPGRTTVATALAGELSARTREPVLLVDADPYGGTAAQHLGVLDEVSGLLSAGRLRASELPSRLPGLCRAVGEDGLGVLTGLPRPDRWTEVPAGVVGELLEAAVGLATVVVDTGFGLQGGPGDPAAAWQGPGRDTMTVESLEGADEILVVGAADPVGLARLARGLVDLRECLGDRPVRVVVNRMRPGLGWSRSEVAATVEGFATLAGIHFLPDDRTAADRALVHGRSVPEMGDSPLRRAVAELTDAVFPHAAAARPAARWPALLRPRRAGTARRR